MMAEGSASADLSSPFLLAASRLVACGLNVIPVHRENKTPAIPRWKKFQTERLLDRDVDEIDDYLVSWWGREDPYNLAVVTGEISGVAVVDVDSLAAHQLVISTIGCWPRTVNSDAANHPAVTPTATTANDGWHLWYRHEAGMRNVVRRGGEALDARADGGYVIVPPSAFGRRDYRWGVCPFVSEGGVWPPMPMPEDLRELLWPARAVRIPPAAPTIERGARYIEAAVEHEIADVAAAVEGTRNDRLNRAAFSLARFVHAGMLPASRYVEELSAAAARAGLAETEIRATLASALKGRS